MVRWAGTVPPSRRGGLLLPKPLMHLGFDLSYTHMGGRWRMPGGWGETVFPDVAVFEQAARIAERARTITPAAATEAAE